MNAQRVELQSQIKDLGGAIDAMAEKLLSHEKAETDPELAESLGLRFVDWSAYQNRVQELRGNLFDARRRRYALQLELKTLGSEAPGHAA